jgi:hypothetical protein
LLIPSLPLLLCHCTAEKRGGGVLEYALAQNPMPREIRVQILIRVTWPTWRSCKHVRVSLSPSSKRSTRHACHAMLSVVSRARAAPRLESILRHSASALLQALTLGATIFVLHSSTHVKCSTRTITDKTNAWFVRDGRRSDTGRVVVVVFIYQL